MENQQLLLAQIQKKISSLLADREVLLTKIGELENQNKSLLEELEAEKNNLADIKEKNKMLKIVESLPEGEDKKTDIKLKINELILEIDRSIASLNK